ncbi:MAG: hypothetical protein LBO00_04300, partial [Zoogloeaceae bacterium]|nr:hypothetical protein [Zoogloeaceae bacterium]
MRCKKHPFAFARASVWREGESCPPVGRAVRKSLERAGVWQYIFQPFPSKGKTPDDRLFLCFHVWCAAWGAKGCRKMNEESAMQGQRPKNQGLYDPAQEHDACGVGFVAHMKGRKSHSIVEQGLLILRNLDHRGAVGADPQMGDGAGILIQVPDQLYREEMEKQGVTLPPA